MTAMDLDGCHSADPFFQPIDETDGLMVGKPQATGSP
jgi:hypothetical protein